MRTIQPSRWASKLLHSKSQPCTFVQAGLPETGLPSAAVPRHPHPCAHSHCDREGVLACVPDSIRIFAIPTLCHCQNIFAEYIISATQVCDDIRSILRIEGCDLFKSSINRPNLFYEASALLVKRASRVMCSELVQTAELQLLILPQ